MEKPTACRECGERVTQARTGRPRVYCGSTCRRAAEYELRRLRALLSRAGQREQDARAKRAVAEQWQVETADRLVEFWSAEVDRLRSALRGALADLPALRNVS